VKLAFVCVKRTGREAKSFHADEENQIPGFSVPGAGCSDRRDVVCTNAVGEGTLFDHVLVLAGRSKAEIVQATGSALDKKELPVLEPGAMCYMLSKQQYLSDQGKSWHPHLMFLIPGNAVKSWGANLAGSPVIAANDPEERATIFMVWVAAWSDGTPAPPIAH